jgi:hypothetical protein
LPALDLALGVDGELDGVGLELAIVHDDEALVGERGDGVGAEQLTRDQTLDDLALPEEDAERGSRCLRSSPRSPAEPPQCDAEPVRIVDDGCDRDRRRGWWWRGRRRRRRRRRRRS